MASVGMVDEKIFLAMWFKGSVNSEVYLEQMRPAVKALWPPSAAKLLRDCCMPSVPGWRELGTEWFLGTKNIIIAFLLNWPVYSWFLLLGTSHGSVDWRQRYAMLELNMIVTVFADKIDEAWVRKWLHAPEEKRRCVKRKPFRVSHLRINIQTNRFRILNPIYKLEITSL